MEYCCAECETSLPEERGTLFRLVRGEGGTTYTWGTISATTAPSALLCQRCIMRLGLHDPVIWNPNEVGSLHGCVFGWQFTESCCSHYYAPEWFVRQKLPKTVALLTSLERRGVVPEERTPTLSWFVTWWRAMITKVRGGIARIFC